METILECAICFDEITEPTTLPCACKVSYCSRCWDHALASSFNSGDQSRCPTCRTPVRVDFDAEQCCLVFSREIDDGADVEAIAQGSQRLTTRRDERVSRRRTETIQRLASQAIPAMKRILTTYREHNAVVIDGFLESPLASLEQLPSAVLEAELTLVRCSVPLDGDDTTFAQSLVNHANDKSKIASFLISTSLIMPPCVCGSTLARVSSHERYRRYLLKRGVKREMLEELVTQRVGSGQGTNMICDLCDGKIPFHTFVWTCKSDDSTVLHAMTYDICDDCFTTHACAPLSQKKEPS